MSIALARFVVVVLALAWPQLSSAQSVEDVIEKSIAALGGRAAHAKIKSRLATGTITLQTPAGDIPGTIEVLNALPNKSRTLIKADLSQFGAGPLTIDQRFDGQNGYVLDSLQGNRDITGNQLDNMRSASFPHPFIGYKEMGVAAKLAPREKIGDRDMLVILFEPAAGSTIKQFVDAETFLPVRFSLKVNVPQLGADIEQTTDLSDYREVDGVKVAFKLASSSSVQSFTINVEKVEHNGAVDDKLFVKP